MIKIPPLSGHNPFDVSGDRGPKSRGGRDPHRTRLSFFFFGLHFFLSKTRLSFFLFWFTFFFSARPGWAFSFSVQFFDWPNQLAMFVFKSPDRWFFYIMLQCITGGRGHTGSLPRGGVLEPQVRTRLMIYKRKVEENMNTMQWLMQ